MRSKTSKKAGRRRAPISAADPGDRYSKGDSRPLPTAALGAMLSLPFLITYHQFPITSFYSEWLVFPLALVAFAMLARSPDFDRLAIPGSVLAPLLLGVVVLVQAALGAFAFPEQPITVALYLALAAVLMITGATLQTEMSGPPATLVAPLACCVLAGGLLDALAGIIQWFALTDSLRPFVTLAAARNASGTLAQSNHLANHLALSLGSLAYLAVARRLRLRWAAPLAFILLFAMVLTGSRSTWVYLLVFVLLAFSTVRSEPKARALIVATVSLLAAYAIVHAALYALFSSGAPGVGNPLERLQNVQSGAVSPRTYLWEQALSMFREAPAFGVGFGEFSYRMFLQWPLDAKSGVSALDNHAHNAVFQLLAVSGVIGLLSVLAPMLRWLAGQLSMPRTVEAWWVWALIGVLGFHSMVEQPMWYAYFLAPAALLLGLSDPKRITIDMSGLRRWFIVALAGIGIVCAAKIAVDYDRLEGWLYTFKYARGASPEAQAAALRELEAHSLFAPFVRMADPGIVVPVSAPAAEKVAFNLRIMRFAPVAEMVYRHAVLLAAASLGGEAILQLRRAAAVYPGELPLYASRIQQLAEREPGLYSSLAAESRKLLAVAQRLDSR